MYPARTEGDKALTFFTTPDERKWLASMRSKICLGLWEPPEVVADRCRTETATEPAIESDAFGPMTAELRRAAANYYDLAVLLPRLVRVRDFGDADDIAAVLRHRLAAVTVRSAGAGRARRAPRLIAGLIPEAMGAVADDM